MWMRWLLIGLVRALVGAAPRWIGSLPSPRQRLYFANHSSHIDTLALWSALPAELRPRTRPVAAADYWNRDPLRRLIAREALNVVFIERFRARFRDPGDEQSEASARPSGHPLQPLIDALEQGDSLILFPEGTRTPQALPGPFKPGLYHLASRFPDLELVPVYLENLHRSLPKGSLFPVPLICTVRFGAVLERIPDESRSAFLERARSAVMELA